MDYRRFILQDGVQNQQVRFTIAPNGKSVTLSVSLRYRKQSQRWYMSIFDIVNQQWLVTNIPVLCSENLINNLITQFSYMNIGTAYVQPNSDADSGIDPAFDNITSYKIIWSD